MNSSTVSKLEPLAGLESAKRIVLKLAKPDSSPHAVLPGSKAEALEILSEGAPGRRVHVEQHREPYLAIHAIAANLSREPAIRALALAEEFRSAADQLEKSLGSNARSANVEALRAFGTCVAEIHHNPDWMTEIAEAHRRILGNGSAGLVLDAMFARILAP